MIFGRGGKRASGPATGAREPKGSDMDEAEKAGSRKPRKRAAGKAPDRPGALDASKVKLTHHLSLQASQRLAIHAEMTGMTRSDLVEKLIVDHLRRFVVSDRGGPADGATSGPLGIVAGPARESA